LMIPSEKVGVVIGKGGEMIQDVMSKSGALVKVEREHNPNHPSVREVQVLGAPEQVAYAIQMVKELCNERSIRNNGQTEYEETMAIPQNLVGIVIGKAGETIKNIQRLTKCSVQVVSQGDPLDPMSIKVVKFRGIAEEIAAAKQQINLLTGVLA
ncbi:hypothetical protein MHBO_004778, partial [Bonamia ostreae]